MIKQRILELRQSLLFKRILTVVGGNSLAQAVVLLAAPLLTRVYSPEVFGIQGVFLAAISLLSPLIALRLPMAIVLADSEHELKKVESVSLISATLTSLMVLLSLLFFRNTVAGLLGLESIGYLVLFLPLALFFTAIQEISDYKAARRNRFKAISVVAVIQATITNSSRLIAGIIAPVASVLVVITSLAPALQATMMTFSDKTNRSLAALRSGNKEELVAVIKRYRDFPLFRMPTDLLNAALQNAPVLLLSFYFGPEIAGYYVLTKSALTVPTNVVGNAIGNVFYSHFAQLKRDQRSVTSSMLKSAMGLFFGPGLLVIIVSFFGPVIFGLIFGNDWETAGEYARWLSIATVLTLANVPAIRLVPVIGHQPLLLYANFALFFACSGSIIVSERIFHDPLAAVAAFSITSGLGTLVLLLIITLRSSQFDKANKEYGS